VPGDRSVATFYDGKAGDYEIVYGGEWERAVEEQGAALDDLIRASVPDARRVLDCACGIGTQAIGLAQAGFAVTATDISPVSVQRCAREAAARGLRIATDVADLRDLAAVAAGGFDVAVTFDNALAHLLDDAGLDAACAALRRVLRPGGALLASIRDYDEILRERPSGDPPRRLAAGDGERIVFQVWDWLSDDRYDLRHFIMTRRPAGWGVSERTTTYRALTRAALADALRRAGFEEVAWRMPADTGFYQPIVTARAASAGSGGGR